MKGLGLIALANTVRASARAVSRAVCAAALTLGTFAGAAQAATDMAPLISACTEGRLSLADRAAKIEALGYVPIKPESRMWVQGQILHIAMSGLETGDTDFRGVYNSFRQSADAGDMFRDDIEIFAFSDAAGTVHISLSEPDGNDAGCSFAFARGATGIKMPLRVLETWTHKAGTYTEYRINGGRYATASTFGAPWRNWVKGRQLASVFMVVSK